MILANREKEKAKANPLKALHNEGQAVWLDFLSRRFLIDNGLKQLIEHDGLTGVS
jgi:transaldolase/glucose-6-phosphate isomerase